MAVRSSAYFCVDPGSCGYQSGGTRTRAGRTVTDIAGRVQLQQTAVCDDVRDRRYLT